MYVAVCVLYVYVGMQIGHFFDSSSRDYIIFEKNSTAGHFYKYFKA